MYRAPLETRVSLTLSRHSARTSESTAEPEPEPEPDTAHRRVEARQAGWRSAECRCAGRVARRACGVGVAPSIPWTVPRSAVGGWVLGAGCCALRPPSVRRARRGTS